MRLGIGLGHADPRVSGDGRVAVPGSIHGLRYRDRRAKRVVRP